MEHGTKGPRYIAGVDGGGSKTACMIADETGRILSYAVAQGSNHQIAGLSMTVKNVCFAIKQACAQIGIQYEQLSFIYIGIAGADLEEDYILLKKGFSSAFRAIPFSIINDVWIAFSCKTGSNWGAVSICGTGNNLAVKSEDGTIYSVRALRYMLGNYGGGHHLAEIALHHTFRCEEGTGRHTRLVDILPAYCECTSMDELARRIYESDYQYYKDYNIPKLVFDLAWGGDQVCLDIITTMGHELGTMLAGLIAKAGLQDTEIPVVLSGSQYSKDEHQLLLGPLMRQLRTMVPKAQVEVVKCPPVVGAVISGLQKIGVKLADAQREEMQNIASGRYS